MKLRRLEWGVDLEVGSIPEDEVAFLRKLEGPSLIALSGADASRVRVVTTLLHGNEPSGLRAMHRWLQTNPRPATRVLLFVASVDTALSEPVFSHRQLPERRDFNRCFRPPWSDPEGRLAEQVLGAILAARPECVVDLHNNTGHNPAYGVAVRLGDPELGLVRLFADRVVHAPLALGTLVEATIDACPSITIECGRSGDPVADEIARTGLEALVSRDDLDLRLPSQTMRILDEPIRVCVTDPTSIGFGTHARRDVALTISADIDRHNFERLPAGSTIGWIHPGSDWPLDARRPDGRECSRDIFRVREGILETRCDFIPIMMTTRPEIAKSDCLFYAARENGTPG